MTDKKVEESQILAEANRLSVAAMPVPYERGFQHEGQRERELDNAYWWRRRILDGFFKGVHSRRAAIEALAANETHLRILRSK
ncbi:MAG: hypothetical protein GWN31_08335 [Candidatus Thorarchaeota archaeon]|nr:hypothetical protein [Candidatus Thorarchaeota archaeon]NIW13925.1 hypothetical protein [Candidatus Thorarchaeota archaeon]NIW52044.1 hypothetical protein [Candidatus Korarchaeota archaeon]